MPARISSDFPFEGFHLLALAMTFGAAALEWALAFGLWFAKPRRWLVPAGVAFHATIYVLFPVDTFSVTTVLAYLAFFPPDRVHAVIDRLHHSPAWRERT